MSSVTTLPPHRNVETLNVLWLCPHPQVFSSQPFVREQAKFGPSSHVPPGLKQTLVPVGEQTPPRRLFLFFDVFGVWCVVDSRSAEKTKLTVTNAWPMIACSSTAPEQTLKTTKTRTTSITEARPLQSTSPNSWQPKNAVS